MSQSTALVAAGAATAFLALVHGLLPHVRSRLEDTGESVVAAVSGGVAAGYVFIHLLPELARGNEELAEVLGDTTRFSAVADVALFVTALAGFVLLYGLDHAAARMEGPGGVFGVHLAVYAAYNGLITYSLPTQFRAGTPVAVLFVLAMGVHFLLSDRALAAHHGDRFRAIGRPVLVAALAMGYALAWLFAPTSTMVVSLLLAVLAGFVLYNVFSDELPSEHSVRFPVFAASTALYAALLLGVVAFGN